MCKPQLSSLFLFYVRSSFNTREFSSRKIVYAWKEFFDTMACLGALWRVLHENSRQSSRNDPEPPYLHPGTCDVCTKAPPNRQRTCFRKIDNEQTPRLLNVEHNLIYHYWFIGLNQGSKQRTFVSEGFVGCSGVFGGYFWRSFPYKNPRKSAAKT